MSALRGRIQRAVSDYLAGTITLAELDGIASETLYSATDAGDVEALDIASSVALRLSEFWDDAWSDDDMRGFLSAYAGPVTVTLTFQMPEFEYAPPVYWTSAEEDRTVFLTASV